MVEPLVSVMCVGKMWKFVTFFGLLTLVLEGKFNKIHKFV